MASTQIFSTFIIVFVVFATLESVLSRPTDQVHKDTTISSSTPTHTTSTEAITVPVSVSSTVSAKISKIEESPATTSTDISNKVSNNLRTNIDSQIIGSSPVEHGGSSAKASQKDGNHRQGKCFGYKGMC